MSEDKADDINNYSGMCTSQYISFKVMPETANYCSFFCNQSTWNFPFFFFLNHLQGQRGVFLLTECLLLFSCKVMSDSLRPHVLQYPSLSLYPGVCSHSCSLSQWCHPTISSSVIPFSCSQSFPASGYFPISSLFPSGGQSSGAWASAPVLPMNIQDWFPLIEYLCPPTFIFLNPTLLC